MAHHLDRARRRARRAAREHEREEGEQRDDGPEREVGSREPRRGDDRDGLEDRGPDGLLALGNAVSPQLDEQRDRGGEDERQVEPELLVAHEDAWAPPDETAEQEHEVHAREEHEERDDPLSRRREGRDRVRLRREAAGRHRGERVRERLVRRHLVVDPEPAERGEEERQQNRQPDVQAPEEPCRRADPLAEGPDLGARELGVHHLPPADAETRQDGDGEDDDPHPAEPLRELAPHGQRAGELVEVRDHARAGRRRRGHALEIGVDRVVELLAADQQVGQGSERGRHQQHRGHHEEALADTDARRASGRALEREAEGAGGRAGHEERPDGLAVPERDPDREHDREAEVLREDADEVEDGGDVDGEPARPADPRDGLAHAGSTDLRALRRPTVRSPPP